MKSILRYKFVPKFQMRDNKTQETLVCGSEYGLKLGIMRRITNDLGYDKIRKSRKTNITTEELYSHLEKMDERTKTIDKEMYWVAIDELIYSAKEYKNFYLKLKEKIEKLFEVIEEEIPKKNELLLSYGTLLPVYKTLLERKDAEIKRLKEKAGKKNLLSRIFN
ncbi:MAG: hypothetical protein ABIE36_01275 [Candidatus Diapherotrites archaeon]